MARLGKKDRAIVRAACDELGYYANELREKSMGTDSGDRYIEQAEQVEAVQADLDEMLYRAGTGDK